jgi:hypothetical protein
MLTIVLMHGAFADASSWNGIIERLQGQGHTVVAAGRSRAASGTTCRRKRRKRLRTDYRSRP